MPEELTLTPLEEIHTPDETKGPPSRLHVYESSVGPYVAIATRGPGMRLTRDQVFWLYKWLGEWLDA